VRLWEAETGRPVATLQGHTGAVRSVALSADGQLLASGTLDGKVRLGPLTGVAEREGLHGMQAEASIGRPVVTLQTHASMVYGVALSADGELVASGGGEGKVRVWETSTGRPLATIRGHSGMAWGVALSTDGRVVASGGEDRMVRLREAHTGQPLAALRGHTGAVYSVALSADGALLASGGFDATARLWETGTGRLLATLQGHTAPITAVAISGDGRLLARGAAGPGRDRAARRAEWAIGDAKCACTPVVDPHPDRTGPVGAHVQRLTWFAPPGSRLRPVSAPTCAAHPSPRSGQ
jgi:WD40 repeat protein